MKAKVTVNLMKWESCKAVGETPEMFEKRMQYFIGADIKQIKYYLELADAEKDDYRREWELGCVKYHQRRLKRIEKEIKKAYANA